MTGQYATFMHPMKPFCYFVLTEELTTSDVTAAAEITVQIGYGQAHPVKAIIVYNMPASTDFTFEGAVGKMGIAAWDEGRGWCILNMQCPD